jgi:hypothetical protein
MRSSKGQIRARMHSPIRVSLKDLERYRDGQIVSPEVTGIDITSHPTCQSG